MKRTKWFPSHIKPVHIGVYEVKDAYPPWYRYWNGRNWFVGGNTPTMATQHCGIRIDKEFYMPWRGIVKE